MSSSATISSVLKRVRNTFEQADVETAAQEARILVAGVLGISATELIAGGERNLSIEQTEKVQTAVDRRLAGEPVHRILGVRSFYGLDFKLSPATLEPRPDTEILVDTVLEMLKAKTGSFRILDLGTGTGAICLALLHELPTSAGVGVDISRDALGTALENAAALGLGTRFEVVLSDWFSNIEGRFDVIVSNPPYIESNEIGKLPVEVREFDPVTALDGGSDGLEPYRIIAAEAERYLTEDGFVAVETGWKQRESVTIIFEAADFKLVNAVKDFGGNDRVLVFRR